MKKKIFTLLTLALVSIGSAWAAADFTYSIGATAGATTLALSDGTYATTIASSATALKKKTAWVEVPSASCAGYISFYGNGTDTNRHIFIWKTNGTVIDESRSIDMLPGWNDASDAILFSASDILTSGGKYYLVFTSNGTDYKFKGVKYTLATEPVITTQPVGNSYVSVGAIEALTIEAVASAGSLTYQWYSCDDAEKTNASAISGATSSSYTPSAAGYYFCRLTDSNKSVDSNVAQIIIAAASAPTLSIAASATSVYETQAVTLTATMTGVPVPTIQWYSNTTASNEGGVAIDGATSETYSPSTESTGTFYYYAVATNGISPDATSNVLTVTVNSADIDRTGYNSYYVAEGEFLLSGKVITCDDITMTYGTASGYNVIKDETIKTINANFVASASSTTNGWGVTFTPTADGVLSVGVVVNGTKEFSITNVSSFDYNGIDQNSAASAGTNNSNTWTPSLKQYTIVTIPVTSGTTYTFSVSGSKMSVYGFEFTPGGVAATITAAEYATFVPATKVSVPDGVKAYIATAVDASAITLSEVSVIPANEPVIINGAAGDYLFPVSTAAASDVTGNLLKAGPVTGDGAKYYALGKPGTVVGFGLLKDGVALPATKAYIPADVFGGGAPAFVPFSFAGSETTAISEAKVATIANGAVYNLNGQRVAQPTKGLYIINGKKYMVK